MEKCDHINFDTMAGLYGPWMAMCGTCCLTAKGPTRSEAIINLLKEKTMSSDYSAGFEAGVKAATQPMSAQEWPSFGARTTYRDGWDELLAERRKKLLTKKVTKYAVILSRSRGPERERAYYTYGDLHEGRASAEIDARQYLDKARADTALTGSVNPELHGVFPIEIEIPL